MTTLILGGTTESRTLAEQLVQEEHPAIISVATRYGLERLERGEPGNADFLTLRQGRLDESELHRIIEGKNVSSVVDATHPYAEVISKVAERAVNRVDHCTFVRLKRPRADLPEHHLIQNASSPDEVARELGGTNGRILLTTGTANLEHYVRHLDTGHLFARVLPFSRSIDRCRDAGVPSSHIIAMQGPFSVALNRATFRQYRIDLLVSKRSGPASGVKQKVEAGIAEQCSIFLIDRPNLPVPDRSFEDVNSVVNWLVSHE